MTRALYAATATLMTTTAVACAQDFNAAQPNVPEQQPAFEGQTRAPVLPDDIQLNTENVVEGLEHPWGMDQLPDGSWLVTERPGRLRMVHADGTLSEPITGIPEVDNRQQGGLLDVLVADDFAESRRIWLSYAAPAGNGETRTAVATATLSSDNAALENLQEIFQQQPSWPSTMHFGSRLVPDGKGGLFVTLGERSVMESRMLAQNDDNHFGKVVRIDPLDGSVPDGNPQVEGWLPEVWSKGHRNVQAAALDDQGRLWVVDHGPQGGDEVNMVEAGLNYGWPTITYGEEYSGEPIGEGLTQQEGMEQPVYYWDPVIAPSGMVFYRGEMFPEWNGQILVGGMVAKALVRLQVEGDRVTGEARHLQGIGRVRDVDVAQEDGSLMLLTDADNAAMVRVTRQ